MIKALYKKYKKSIKESVVSLIRNFAEGSVAPLSGKFFEMISHNILWKGETFKV